MKTTKQHLSCHKEFVLDEKKERKKFSALPLSFYNIFFTLGEFFHMWLPLVKGTL